LGESGAWAYPGTAQIFGVSPIISGTGKAKAKAKPGKATNLKFAGVFTGFIRTKAP